ncbi:MAG: universal stress protein [Solirubrobacteraceae bacterium]
MTDHAPVPAVTDQPLGVKRIAAGISLGPEGDDAARLASALTTATSGDLLLVVVEPDLPLVIPGADWRKMRRETEALLSRTKASFAPGARVAIDTDLSIPRGLRRLMSFQHRQLLVTGSRHNGPAGEVSLGNHTRQLLHDLPCALAIAVRGLSTEPDFRLTTIGVGYDGGEEATAALGTAAGIAAGAGAELIVRGVIDDRVPAFGWSRLWGGSLTECWEEVMEDEVRSLRTEIEQATAGLPGTIRSEVRRGRPSEGLMELSGAVDLLVIGSRRWGPVARLMLGGTGEALAHGSHASLLVVPRPPAD